MPGLVRRATEVGDIFESSVNLEESHYQLGFDEGYKDGVESGKVDGREVGLKNGFQVGEEIGFYTGCVDIWKAAVAVDARAFSPRAQRSIKQFEDKLLAYPLSNPEDERIQDLLEDIRVKFQAILSMLAIHLEYPGVHPQQTPAVATRTLQEAPNTVPAPPPQQEIVTLVLRPRKTVSWGVETVDNEHMQKKSSKICCVFHKELEDSSDEDESCGGKGKGDSHHPSDETDDCGDAGKGKGHNHYHSLEVAESSGKSKE